MNNTDGSKVKLIHQMMMLNLSAMANSPQHPIGQQKRAPVARRPDSCRTLSAYQLAPIEKPTTRGSSENTLVNSAEVGSVRYSPVGLCLSKMLVAKTFANHLSSGAL